MKIKRLLCYIICAAIVTITTSFNASAKDSGCYIDLPDTRIESTSSDTFTTFEINSIAEGTRQTINDAIGTNNGCKVIVYISYNSMTSSLIEPQMMMSVNYNNISLFNQIVYLKSNAVVFDFDTVMAKANWNINQRSALIRDITFGVNTDITIKGIEVVVPKLESLAAAAPCRDNAIKIH